MDGLVLGKSEERSIFVTSFVVRMLLYISTNDRPKVGLSHDIGEVCEVYWLGYKLESK